MKKKVREDGYVHKKNHFWALVDMAFLLEKLGMDVSSITHGRVLQFAKRRISTDVGYAKRGEDWSD